MIDHFFPYDTSDLCLLDFAGHDMATFDPPIGGVFTVIVTQVEEMTQCILDVGFDDLDAVCLPPPVRVLFVWVLCEPLRGTCEGRG
jgi:hypothetical protein